MPARGEAIAGGSAGDLYIKVHVKADPAFAREGNNLTTTLSVKLTDALLGAKYPVTTLDGTITLTVPAGVQHGEVLRVRGKGVPTPESGRGDLLVRIAIPLPQKLSRSGKKLVQQLQSEGL